LLSVTPLFLLVVRTAHGRRVSLGQRGQDYLSATAGLVLAISIHEALVAPKRDPWVKPAKTTEGLGEPAVLEALAA
jgi:hypothetical protein